LFKRETLSGEFLQINGYLVRDLQARGLWTESIRDKVKTAEGSIQDIEEIPQELKDIYRTVWEIPMRSLIDMAADRGAFIDQSQSLNLFMETPTIGKLSSMYMYAWQQGIKTTYYLRSRPATRIRQSTTSADVAAAPTKDETVDLSLAEKIACSLENPESCESCQ
jgi:ribonucleoside-diphosphate reductase alpha chain